MTERTARLPNAPALERLVDTLRAQERLFLEMRELLLREHDAIVELEASEVERLAAAKGVLAAEGELLETTRAAIAEEVASELGLDTRPATLTAICRSLGLETGALGELRSRLRALVSGLQSLTEANARLAESALGDVRSTLQLFEQALVDSPTYATPAETTSPLQRPGLLLDRSA